MSTIVRKSERRATAEKTDQAEGLSDYSKRDEQWDKHRSSAQRTEALYASDGEGRYARLAERMHSCSTWLTFGWRQPDEHGETGLKLKNGSFCGCRWCTVDQARRARRNMTRFMKALPEITAAYPTARWVFLTLTVPNPRYADLRATIAAMNKGWQRLIQRKDWPAIGWVRSVEVTKGNVPGHAHPHFHCLLLVPASYFGKGYVAQSAWLDRWQSAMRRDDIQVLDVKAVKPKMGQHDIGGAAAEVLKYGTKPSDIADEEFLFALTDQLHKMRFIASGGALKGVLLKDDMTNDELVHADAETPPLDEAAGEMHFSWDRARRRYFRAQDGRARR